MVSVSTSKESETPPKKMNCLLVFSLAVLGACSAAPCGFNNFNTVNTGCVTSEVCGTALPGRTLYAQTPVIENPTRVIPTCVPSTSVSQSCHCLKTIVRPQIRNEIISVPQIDRIVRVVPSPVVEVSSVNLGGNTRNVQLPTCGVSSGISGGIVESGLVGGVSGIVGGVTGGFGGIVGQGCGGVVSQGFGGVVSSGIVGNVGCGCGSNIIA